MRCKKRKEGPGDSLMRNRNKGKSAMDSCTLEMMVVGMKNGGGLSYCSKLEVSSIYTTSVCTCLHLFTIYPCLYLLFF